ncbi:MAG: hypothetical protein AAGH99_03040 [Planctomycetota bacterium]
MIYRAGYGRRRERHPGQEAEFCRRRQALNGSPLGARQLIASINPLLAEVMPSLNAIGRVMNQSEPYAAALIEAVLDACRNPNGCSA